MIPKVGSAGAESHTVWIWISRRDAERAVCGCNKEAGGVSTDRVYIRNVAREIVMLELIRELASSVWEA